jgi:hypothetical protein
LSCQSQSSRGCVRNAEMEDMIWDATRRPLLARADALGTMSGRVQSTYIGDRDETSRASQLDNAPPAEALRRVARPAHGGAAKR